MALARLLLDGPELLLLDEPTNHLDLEGVDWLARHLAARRGAVVVVTHDRWFLDAVCERTWEVDAARVLQHDGGYAAWVLARAERERVAAATEERRRNLLRKELAWLRRGPPARTSKPRFRIDAANALIADEPEPRDRAELLRFATARLGKSVLDVEDATVELGERTILRRVTWRLGPGDRVGVVGVNGSGKTTLLRLLAGDVAPSHGVVKTGQTVRLAVLSQHLEELDGELRVLQALESIRPRVSLGDGRELTAGQLCERFGFGGNRQWTFVADLSGGERRRLQLMRLLMGEPNVLLLDEPTNDLDIDTLTALEDLLDGWPGSLVVVSHDRYFVERVCTDVYGLPGDGRIVHLPGGIEQYVEQRRAEQRGRRRRGGAGPPRGRPHRPAAASLRQARKDADRLERELGRLDARETELHELLADQRDGLRPGGGARRGAAGAAAAARHRRGGVARGRVAAGGRIAPRARGRRLPSASMKVTWRDGGSVLTSHAEWLDRIDPKNLQPGTSAPTLAAAWAGIVELYGVLHNQPSLTRFTIDEIVVEAQTTFDEFPSGPRNHDLVVRGSLPDRARAVVCVEAKAGEDLGTTIAAQRVEAERAKAANPRSNATARLDGLLRRFVSPDHPPEETDRLRYQLLTALAGTIAEASAIGAAHAVLMLHDFRTDERRDDLASEHDDQLRAFARAVFGVDTPPRGSVPWCVHLGSVAEAPTLELYLAWAVTDLSEQRRLRRGADACGYALTRASTGQMSTSTSPRTQWNRGAATTVR